MNGLWRLLNHASPKGNPSFPAMTVRAISGATATDKKPATGFHHGF
jgi:hypothetical protein